MPSFVAPQFARSESASGLSSFVAPLGGHLHASTSWEKNDLDFVWDSDLDSSECGRRGSDTTTVVTDAGAEKKGSAMSIDVVDSPALHSPLEGVMCTMGASMYDTSDSAQNLSSFSCAWQIVALLDRHLVCLYFSWELHIANAAASCRIA